MNATDHLLLGLDDVIIDASRQLSAISHQLSNLELFAYVPKVEDLTLVKLSQRQVEHVAQLAKLALDEDEKELFRDQLSSILEYAARLQDLDTDDIPPTATVLPLENVLREDRVRPSLSQEDALANAPAVEDGHVCVPLVLEEGR